MVEVTVEPYEDEPLPDVEVEEVPRKYDPSKHGVSILPGTGLLRGLGSEHAAQFAAGISDIATAIPMLGGLGTGLFNTIGDQITGEEGSFADQFKKRITTGTAGDLLKAGGDARRYVNEALGLEEPRQASLQGARLLGSFIPIPIAPAASLAGKIGRGALAVTTPVVKAGSVPSVLARGAAQATIGGGLDQAIRAISDDPVNAPLAFTPESRMTREEAMAHFSPDARLPDVEVERLPDVEIEVDANVAEVDPDFVEKDRAVQRQQDRNTSIQILGTIGVGLAAVAGIRYGRRIQARQAMAIGERGSLGTTAQPRTLAEPISAVKFAGEIGDIAGDQTRTPAERASAASAAAGRFVSSGVSNLHGKHVNSISYVNAVLREHGFVNERKLTDLDSAMSTDSFGMAREVYDSGNFGAVDEAFKSHRSGHSVGQVEREFLTLDDIKKAKFVKGMAAIQTRTARRVAGGDETVGMWRTSRYDQSSAAAKNVGQREAMSNPEISRWIDDMMSDDQLRGMADKYGKAMDDFLDYMVQRNFITKEIAKEWSTQVKGPFIDSTTGKFVKGGIHVPGIEAGAVHTWFTKLADRLGKNTDAGKNLREIASTLSRAQTGGLSKGIRTPLDPFSSAKLYMGNLMHAINQNSMQYNIMSTLTNTADAVLDGNTVRMPSGWKPPTDPGANRFLGIVNPDRPVISPITGNPRSDINLVPGDDIARNILKLDDPNVARMQVEGASQYSDNIVVVQRHGQEFAYYVPDPHLRVAMTLNPELVGLLKTSRFLKDIFTQGTTGKYSLFSPISGLYSMQQAMMNAATRTGSPIAGSVAAARVAGDAFRGAFEIFRVDASRAWADILYQSIARNTGLAALNPQLAIKLEEKLVKAYSNTMLRGIRAESGRTATAIGSESITNSVSSHLDELIPKVSEMWGVSYAQGVGRTWAAINRAMHEGTATGLTMRTLKNAAKEAGVEPNTLPASVKRQAIFGAKQLTGDVTRRGTSEVARIVDATIPFSGAMIQSWNTIGSAMKSVGYGKGLAMMTGIVGIPTVAEMMLNHASMISDTDENGDRRRYVDGNGRAWTQQEYYWTGLNETQRTMNTVMMIPGKPPWEAQLIPISPEWSLFRSLTMEGIDALLNLSDVDSSPENNPAGAHLYAAVIKVFDIPLPPPLAAIFSGMGIDLRAGPHEVIGPDGSSIEFISARQSFTGQGRIGGATERGRYVNSFHRESVANMINDIFGSAGLAYLQVSEAFLAGANQGLDRGFEDAFEAIKDEAGRQARYTQSVFGNALAPNKDNSLSRDLFAKKSMLTDLSRAQTNRLLGAGVIDFATGMPLEGNTLMTSDDPIFNEIVASSRAVLSSIKGLQDDLNKIQKTIDTLGLAISTAEEPLAGNLSYRERRDRIQALTLEINANRARQLAELNRIEEEWSESMSKRLGRKVTIDLSSVSPRPNIGEGPFGTRPPKPLPPSLSQR